MKCNNCQFENAPGATACAQCGNPLPVPQQGGYTQQGYAAPPQYGYRRMPVNCQVCGAMNPPEPPFAKNATLLLIPTRFTVTKTARPHWFWLSCLESLAVIAFT